MLNAWTQVSPTTGPKLMETTEIAEAIAPYRGELIADGVVQLTQLWQKDMEGVSASVGAELIKARLADPAWSHFKRSPGTTAAAPPPAPQDLAAFGPHAPAMAAATERFNVGLKASVGAGQLGGAPGLAGTYK